MADDLYAAIEACKQNMLRSLDTFEQQMKDFQQQRDNQFQLLMDTTRQTFGELRSNYCFPIAEFQQALSLELAAYNNQHEETINKVIQRLEDTIPTLLGGARETNQESMILEEQPPMNIDPSSRTSLLDNPILDEFTLNADDFSGSLYTTLKFEIMLKPEHISISTACQQLDRNVLLLSFNTAKFQNQFIHKTTIIILVFDPGGMFEAANLKYLKQLVACTNGCRNWIQVQASGHTSIFRGLNDEDVVFKR